MWFNSILILSTQRQLQIPQVKFQSYKTAFPPSRWPSVSLESWLLPVHLTDRLQWGVPTACSLNFRCQLQVQVVFYLYFWLTDCKTGSQDPLLGLFCSSQNWEAFYSPDYLFIMTGYNWQTAKWKRCLGRVWRRITELPCCLWTHHSPQISTRSPAWKFSTSCPFGSYGDFIT